MHHYSRYFLENIENKQLSHSKSNFGLTDVNSKANWDAAYGQLVTVVSQYNKDHPENKIENCSRVSGRNLSILAYALRIGDMSRDLSADDFTQSWDFVHVNQYTICADCGY